MTSMWSEMNPIGASTTSVAPAAANSRTASFTSGSSHGIVGGPLRDWKTSSHGFVIPVAAAIPSATCSATQRCWAT